MLFCDRCGKRFVGTAANGRSARYSYYTCFSRQRYGITTCDAERLPADELEEAVLKALDNTYARTDLMKRAVEREAQRHARGQSTHDDKLAVLGSEIKKSEASLDRYLAAFEDGSMPAEQCGTRVKSLSAKLGELKNQRNALAFERDQATNIEPAIDMSDLASTRRAIAEALKVGTNNTRKALLQGLVAEVRITDRKSVKPTFRVPQNAVRIVSGLAVPTGRYSNFRDVRERVIGLKDSNVED